MLLFLFSTSAWRKFSSSSRSLWFLISSSLTSEKLMLNDPFPFILKQVKSYIWYSSTHLQFCHHNVTVKVSVIIVVNEPTKSIMISLSSYGKVSLNSSSMLPVRVEVNFMLRFIRFPLPVLWMPLFLTMLCNVLKELRIVFFFKKPNKRRNIESYLQRVMLTWSL